MALSELNFYSEALGTQQQVYVVIPQRSNSGEIGISSAKSAEKYKCLYLLHGLSDNHTIWLRRTSVERYASDYGIAVVMPFGDRSFYTDMAHGGKYYTYIAKELPSIMCEFFNISSKREDNFIAGLSMGGYGALKIGMKECKRFSKCAAMSAVADIEAAKELFMSDYINVFGETIPSDEDLFNIAKKCQNDPDKPDIYTCVGTEDFLYKDNIKLRDFLKTLDLNYTYRESHGEHNWAFWDEYIQYILEWMLGK